MPCLPGSPPSCLYTAPRLKIIYMGSSGMSRGPTNAPAAEGRGSARCRAGLPPPQGPRLLPPAGSLLPACSPPAPVTLVCATRACWLISYSSRPSIYQRRYCRAGGRGVAGWVRRGSAAPPWPRISSRPRRRHPAAPVLTHLAGPPVHAPGVETSVVFLVQVRQRRQRVLVLVARPP